MLTGSNFQPSVALKSKKEDNTPEAEFRCHCYPDALQTNGVAAEELPFPKAAEQPIKENYSNKESSYMDRQKQLHANAYAPWTDEEERTLRFLYHQGKSIKELAFILQRNEGSIRSRLKKNGLSCELCPNRVKSLNQ